MKRTATLLLILALLLGAFWLFFSLSEKKGSLNQRDQNFHLPGEELEVVRVEMQGRNGELLILEKEASARWQVNNQFMANESAVKELLGILRHLTVRLPVALSEQEQVNAALEQEGVAVRVYARSHWIKLPGNIRLIPRVKRVRQMLTGEDTPDGESTYMRLVRSDMPFAVHVPGIEGGLADLFSTEVSTWRDPVVLDLTADHIKKIEVTFPERENESFSLNLQSGSVQCLQGGQPVDSALLDWPKIRRFLDSFTGLHYERLYTDAAESLLSTRMRSPHFLEVQVTDQQARITRMRFFYRVLPQEELTDLAADSDVDPNRFFLRVNDGAYALAQYFVFSRIIRPFSFFLLQPETAKDG